VPFLDHMAAVLRDRMEELEHEIWNLSGVTFNISSPRQLAEVLYDKLEVQKDAGLKRVPRTKTGPSTAVGVLERMRGHPVIERVLEYRNLAKLKGTYVEALPRLVNPKTGRVHTSFNQAVTATGRLSSSEPNLQNIPIRTELGRGIRKAFIPEADDWSLLSADYSQIELRVLAHLSGDEALCDTFHRGEDVHRRTASHVFGVPMEEVTADLRSRAKVINFGVIYGMGPQRLARETGMSPEEAGQFLQEYFARYPGVEAYLHRQRAEAARTGEVRTMLGRRRLVPDIHSSNPGLKAAAERVSVNTPVQGSAADMIKVAMIGIDRGLQKDRLRSRMILQVHDEIVLEVPDIELEQVTWLVRREMESALVLEVPVRVDTWSGKTWYREPAN
jgi:DNA polymerase-1